MRTISVRRLLQIGLGVAFAGAAVFYSPPTAGAVSFDTDNDFSVKSNPNGVWSYGSEPFGSLGGPFTLFTTSQAKRDGWMDSWTTPSGFPIDYHNTTGSVLNPPPNGLCSTCVVPAYGTAFHPGSNGDYSLFRFTAPSGGSYLINVTFGAGDTTPTTTDVHVLDSNVSIFDGVVNTYPGSTAYNGTRTLATGETIDFAVGWGADGKYDFDTTLIHGTLTELAQPPLTAVPEPSTLALVASGLTGLGFFRGRRWSHPRPVRHTLI
jgi:hypothetical protein